MNYLAAIAGPMMGFAAVWAFMVLPDPSAGPVSAVLGYAGGMLFVIGWRIER